MGLIFHVQLDRGPQRCSLKVCSLTGQFSMYVVPAEALQRDVIDREEAVGDGNCALCCSGKDSAIAVPHYSRWRLASIDLAREYESGANLIRSQISFNRLATAVSQTNHRLRRGNYYC